MDGGGSSEEATGCFFCGACSSESRNARANYARAKKAVLTDIQNRLDPHPVTLPRDIGGGN